MGERNTISSSFTVNTIEDGQDGVVYEITSGISSVTVPSDEVSVTLATTLYFWKRVGGGERTAYSCYATLFRKKGNSIYAYSQSSSKVTSWAINQGVPSSSYDAVVVCIYDAASTAHSGYLAELVIPVIKNGDTGENGVDGAGSEWVYIRSKTNTPPVMRDDDNYPDSNGKDYEDDEYLPKVVGNSNIEIGNSGDTTNHPYECNDDAKGVSETWPYEWKAKRMKLLNQAGTAREWQKYYDATGSTHAMSLDSNWSKDGKDGKDAASLVFEPAVVVLHADSNGNVLVGQSVYSTVTMMLPSGATTTQITLLSEDLYGDAKGSVSGRTIEVWTDEELLDEDAEGYYAVSYSATINGVTYVAKGSLKITVARDGADGPRGNTGPMSYLAGEYDATVNYGALLTDTGCPVVHYNATDEYWYPTEDYIGAGYPPSVANGWKKAYNFEMVVTKILFTQFAKLGGFVVSGDYMLSQYGELIDVDGNKLTLTQSTDNNGFTHWKYGDVDAYTYFQGYDPMVEYGVLPSIQTRQGVNWQYWNYYETTSDEFYMPVQTTEGNAANTSKLVSLTAGDHYYIYGKDQSGVQHCIMVRVTRYDSTNRRLYGYREKSLGRYVPVLYSATARIFRPVKVVNAATGEEWMSGGKVHVSADGDVTVEGTIRAKNLYRNLCLFSNGVYSTEVFYISSLNDWSRTKGYAVGDYIIGRPDANVEPDFSSDGMVLCTYDADIIQMVPTSNNSWDSSNPLRLPAPKDFPGKVVEITGWSRTTSEVNMYVGSVMGSVSSMCLAVEVSGGKFVPAETATVIAIKTGTTTRFMSMILNGNYYWTKLNEK